MGSIFQIILGLLLVLNSIKIFIYYQLVIKPYSGGYYTFTNLFTQFNIILFSPLVPLNYKLVLLWEVIFSPLIQLFVGIYLIFFVNAVTSVTPTIPTITTTTES